MVAFRGPLLLHDVFLEGKDLDDALQVAERLYRIEQGVPD